MAVTIEQLKERMTDEQRRDMAEIVANEVKRRESMKALPKNYGPRPAAKSNVRSSKVSNALPADALGEMYSEVRDKVAGLRRQQIDNQLAETRTLAAKARHVPRNTVQLSRLMNGKTLLVLGIVTLGVLKIASSIGITKDTQPSPQVAVIEPEALQQATIIPPSIAPQPSTTTEDRKLIGWSVAEKQVLTELDARRVELEKRRQELDRREGEIEAQGKALAERIAELKTLVTKVSGIRKERDNQYEARLEQLASVYGSMAPNEAAPLVAKLDEETSLALLKRMPGKRMGQILSLMDSERAVHLTQMLSEKQSLDEVPAR